MNIVRNTTTPIDLDAMTIAELDTRDAALMQRFWGPRRLDLPYPRLNTTMMARAMGITRGAVLQRCTRGTMPFPVTGEQETGYASVQYFADRADVEVWAAERALDDAEAA